MHVYKTKASTLSGTSLGEVTKQARRVFHVIEKKTKRQSYIRSAYFDKKKVFINYFWPHIGQKIPPERMRRLKYFAAAIDLIEHSRNQPTSQANPNRSTERLHRFLGMTRDGEFFVVQIKENLRTGHLYLMSCFPWKE